MATFLPIAMGIAACWMQGAMRRRGGGRAALLCLAMTVPGAAATPATQSPIALTIHNELPFERRDEAVTCGVPLPRGFVGSADDLTLLAADGRPVPLGATTTSTYHDGTPRWVLLDFRADLTAGGQAVYRLARGTRRSEDTKLVYALRDGVAEIDTGAARFRLDTRQGCWFDSVIVAGREFLEREGPNGPLLEIGESGPLLTVRTTDVAFEDASPMRVVLALRGQLTRDPPEPVAEVVCRIHFYAGQSLVRLLFTLHNPAPQAHPGNIWDLGSGGSVEFEDFSLVTRFATGDWASRVGVSLDQPAQTATRLYQDSSGGVNWNSANHLDKDYRIPTRFRGYRLFDGDRLVGDGQRTEGWIHARSSLGGVAVGVRDFWQNFPKAIEFRSGQLRVGLWPREFAGVHELLGGEQKTHELLFYFHDGTTGDEEVDRRLRAFQRPLYALPAPEALLATRAFWPTAPLDRDNFTLLEQTCDCFVLPVGARRERRDPVGGDR